MRILLTVFICLSALGIHCQESSSKKLLERIKTLELSINEKILKEYIQFCKETKECPAVYGINGNWADKFHELPECKEKREAFVKVDDSLGVCLVNYGFDFKMSAKEKGAFYHRLHNSSAEYRGLRERRDAALRVSNIALLEVMFADYQQRKLSMPTDFISPKTLEVIKGVADVESEEYELRLLKRLYKEKLEKELREAYGLEKEEE